MNIDRWILMGFSFVCIIAIVKFLSREKVRDAWVLFLSLQVITWPAGLFAVEFVEKYSYLFYFKRWNWLSGVISNLIILYIVKKFVFWFKKGLV